MDDASAGVAARSGRHADRTDDRLAVDAEASDTGGGAPSSTRTMHIGELAERTGLSLRTIRHYDEVGILPATSRTEGGFRVYSEDDLERLMVIRRMKPLGFSLEEMTDLLAVLDALQQDSDKASAEGLRARLAAYRATAVERRAKMVETLARADEFIDVLTRY
ncbi:Mercuric resistance operon regulatory protein [Arthrobacter agilis]|uniref:MerR family transcriptional regulator n=1 Tax=Arthrobacter agilis TaxID=37921 RepID=UPI000B56D31F|nr:MerR family transcriptional regulator [Arthrobacter agilis]VDR33452.1 Mercuric resistance operon regulatory protein [Arthrobacter agilis]